MRGLEVSLGGFLQNQLVQRQVRDSPTKPGILQLKILQSLHLVALQATILLPPPNGMDGSPSHPAG